MRLAFCCACGSTSDLEHHHLIPTIEGGSDDETNLITLCHACHGLIHGCIRRPIATLTKAGLVKAKARGTVLGNRTNLEAAQKAGGAAAKAIADQRRANVLPIIEAIQRAGVTTLQGIADALNARGVKTARGGEWKPMTVSRAMAA